MKNSLLLFLFLLFSGHALAQKNTADPKYQMLHKDNYVWSKNYYLLHLFNQVPSIKVLLERDPVIQKITLQKRLQIETALKNYSTDLTCLVTALKFSGQEIQQISSRLKKLYSVNNELDRLVREHIVPSGCYGIYEALASDQILINAWEQDAKAVNYTISVYATGKAPNYPKIDSLSYNVKSKSYLGLVKTSAELSLAQTTASKLFFAPTLQFALQSLELDDRKQVADFEPMEKTVNQDAYAYSRKVNWDNYKYTLILVPGEGPEEENVSLSGGGMLRCRLAALQYHKGLAPFIMVSGGNVHPYKTKFNEALEMKKYLMETLHIPEHAILMEPHARHTTTNMRNCARLIFRYGFPMDKPCITSTIKSQSFYITDAVPERSVKEFGYLPYKNGTRLSDTEAEFYPLAISLQLDFDEPMDP